MWVYEYDQTSFSDSWRTLTASLPRRNDVNHEMRVARVSGPCRLRVHASVCGVGPGRNFQPMVLYAWLCSLRSAGSKKILHAGRIHRLPALWATRHIDTPYKIHR